MRAGRVYDATAQGDVCEGTGRKGGSSGARRMDWSVRDWAH